MDSRRNHYEISRPIPLLSSSPEPSPCRPLQSVQRSVSPSTSICRDANYEQPTHNGCLPAFTRPLSDIRELSEPSLAGDAVKRAWIPIRQTLCDSPTRRHQRNRSSGQAEGLKETDVNAIRLAAPPWSQSQYDPSPAYSSKTPEQSSLYSVSESRVPPRSSSSKRHRQPLTKYHHQHAYMPATAALPQTLSRICIQSSAQSRGRQVGVRLCGTTLKQASTVASRTHVRSPVPTEILQQPLLKHPRIKLNLETSSATFVGGGSIEGSVRVVVDDNDGIRQRDSLGLGTISVDLVGFEELYGSHRACFIALGTDVVDGQTPPPRSMAQSSIAPMANDNNFWPLFPSCSTLPFMITLPLETGPPPFQSKHASIRYTLAATAVVRDTGKCYRVRTSQDIFVLANFDRETALAPLPNPLIATDQLTLPRGTASDSVKMVAGLHRQVWVSGGSVFVDVHIWNRCSRPLRKLELMLERNILCYKSSAATMGTQHPSQARIFERNEQSIVARSLVKQGTSGWNGVEPHDSTTRTCELAVPSGHGSVQCGQYFEVHFVLNVTASLSNSKLVSVQLPITLIHLNSLDIVPNAAKPVSTAIEERQRYRNISRRQSKGANGTNHKQQPVSSLARGDTVDEQLTYPHVSAFSAPGKLILDPRRERKDDIQKLPEALECSPQTFPPKGFALPGWSNSESADRAALADRGSRSIRNSSTIDVRHFASPMLQKQHKDAQVRTGLRGRLRNVASLDSIRTFRSMPGKAESARQRIPQLLGLTATTRKATSTAPDSVRSASATGPWEQPDRGRFGFKAVHRNASGEPKELGMKWWETRNAQEQRHEAGWI